MMTIFLVVFVLAGVVSAQSTEGEQPVEVEAPEAVISPEPEVAPEEEATPETTEPQVEEELEKEENDKVSEEVADEEATEESESGEGDEIEESGDLETLVAPVEIQEEPVQESSSSESSVTKVENDDSDDSEIRVCKIILDEEGNITDGAGLDGNFSIEINGPNGFFKNIQAPNSLTLNTDIVDDNSSDVDAQCAVFDDLEAGEYLYSPESISGSNSWLEPRYHDFFNGIPESLNDFFNLTIDGSDDDNNNADGVINLKKNDKRSLVVVNQLEKTLDTVNVHFTKIVCESEEDLPNWGMGDDVTEINADTAQTFVDESDEACYFARGWDFEYAYDLGNDDGPAGDLYGPADSPWTTFGSTDADGKVSISIDPEKFESKVWFREVLQKGYIPFSDARASEGKDADEFSAEMYCHNDVLNYDNYDFINNPQVNEDYYCVAFNTEIESDLPKVTKFILVDSDTDSDLFELTDGMVINLDDEPLDTVNVRAEVENDPESVIFDLSGSATSTKTENLPVYALFGNSGANYFNGSFTVGTYTLTATPYTQDGGGGYVGTPLTIKFEVVDYDKATINAHKIVCESEEYLPNWGLGNDPIKIDANTAQNFLDGVNEGKEKDVCWFEEGWDFQYGFDIPVEQRPLGDFYGATSSPWMTFGSTDSSGLVSKVIDISEMTKELWIREVLQDGYIPFSDARANEGEDADNVSAEIYCHNDLLNYDNKEFINAEDDGEYYCVAFNVEIEDQTEYPYGIITNPVQDGDVVSGTTTLMAEYYDNDPDVDDVLWAVRAGTCEANQNTVMGNVDGFNDDETWDGQDFSFEFNAGDLESGDYCFIFNPTDDGPVDVRLTREFVVEYDNNGGGNGGGNGDGTGDGDSTPEEETTPTPEEQTSRSSSGGRIARPAAGEVLGATTENACGIYLYDYMRQDLDNNPYEVLKLQLFLNNQGHYVPITGVFGSQTDQAVRDFQSKLNEQILVPWSLYNLSDGVTPTGYVYKTTKYTINNIVCPGSEAFPQLP